ncbi:MAG TPA: hemerythrin domain-containing protein [Bacteroidia bacterium]|nr:hemerythrin domain-containing protein [Bacteroidia bacterium]
MNDSLKTLYEEHAIIVNVIDAAKNAGALIARDPDEYDAYIRKLIHFFRTYADQYHHFKEEEILFPEMAKRNELLGGSILQEMLENHEDFREMIKNIEVNLNKKDFRKAQQELIAYTESLLDHIAAENEEVFPMAETLFSDTELNNLHFRFEDTDRLLGEKQKTELADLSRKLLEDQL